MNLFLIGWSPTGDLDVSPATAAVRRVIEDVPFFEQSSLLTWAAPSRHAVLACAGHTSTQVGGVSYTSLAETRVALFAGRPFRWLDDESADGRAAIDSAYYVAPPDGWMDDLDGRGAAVRYDDDSRTLEVFASVLGLYPLYTTALGEVRWFSNSAGALGSLRGGEVHDTSAIATFVGCGWSLGGQPLWRDVERLPRGTARRLSPDGGDQTLDLLPTERIVSMFGQGWNAPAAARTILHGVRALADWPGRPSLIPLTGGRDSRVVFAAARRAGIAFEAETTAQPGLQGYPDTEDVRLARILCERTGSPHRTKVPAPGLDLQSAISAFRLVSPGAFSLGDVGLAPPEQRRGAHEPLPILLQGLGGELSRTFYGIGEGLDQRGLVRTLYRATTKAWPRTLLSGDGRGVVRDYLAGWVERHMGLGAAPVDIPDLFYLLERMVNWAAPVQGVFECMGGETAPALWTTRLLPHQVGQSAQERAGERFHVPVLQELGPELLEVPFELMNHPSTLPAKLRSELLRRSRHRLRRRSAATDGADEPPDPFPDTMAQVRELVLEQPQHEAWEVLDRKRVARLLGRDPLSVHSRARHQVYRLASVFFVSAAGAGPAAAPEAGPTGS